MNDYIYPATYDRAVDGDTVDLVVDLGFSTFRKTRFRVLGIDTPELNSRDPLERELAKEAKYFVADQLSSAEEIYVKSYKNKTGKYGRYLGDITYRIGEEWYNLSKILTENGMAEEYAS